MKRLFLSFEAMGDAVMRCGMLRVLAIDAELHLAGRLHLGVYADTSWVRGIIDARRLERSRSPWLDGMLGRRSLAGQIAGFDEVVCYERDLRRGLAGWLRVRLPNARIRAIPRDHGQGRGHATEDGAGMLAALGCDPAMHDPVPRLDLSPERLAEAARRLRSLTAGRALCIQAGSALATTPWWHLRRRRLGNPKALPVGNWVALSRMLLERGDADELLMLGSAAERELAIGIRDGLPHALQSRMRLETIGLPVIDMAALVRVAAGLVSVDTGPAHVAAAVGGRVLVAFGPTDTARFAPRGPGLVRTVVHDIPCRPCHGTPRAKACQSNDCLRLLPVGRLYDGVRELLSS